MTPDDIQHEIQCEIVENEYDPAVVRERVQALLAGVSADDETMGAVLHEARLIASARHHEFNYLSGDMERVIGVHDAQLDPMIAWLEANGLTDARRHVFGRKWWGDRRDATFVK
jgi:hypothetical protein